MDDHTLLVIADLLLLPILLSSGHGYWRRP